MAKNTAIAAKATQKKPTSAKVEMETNSEKENVSPNKHDNYPASTLSVPKQTRTTDSKRAGLTLPVVNILGKLRKGHYAKHIRKGIYGTDFWRLNCKCDFSRSIVAAGVYMAAVLEYCVAEVLELAGDVAKDNRKVRIIPRHILLAVESDAELSSIFKKKGVVIAGAGVMPFIHKNLLKVKTAPKKKNKKEEAEDTAVE